MTTTEQRASLRVISEQHLDPELDLPGGAGVTRREPGVRDDPEVRTAEDAPWLPEVRMIEDVENIGPHLHSRPRRQWNGLGDRDIQRLETWSEDGIAPEIA